MSETDTQRDIRAGRSTSLASPVKLDRMNNYSRRKVLVGTLVAVAIGCTPGPPDSDADGAWVGTITTEGGVTTVVNESGSVWGGAATLVPELTIGVDSGPGAYMFGRIRDLYADDRAIYVIDRDVPAVRMYDQGGHHIRDIGQGGPSAATNPWSSTGRGFLGWPTRPPILRTQAR